MSKSKRKPVPVTKTAKGIRLRDEEKSRALVRESEMAGLADFYDAPDHATWDIGEGNGRGSRRV